MKLFNCVVVVTALTIGGGTILRKAIQHADHKYERFRDVYVRGPRSWVVHSYADSLTQGFRVGPTYRVINTELVKR